MPRGEGGLADEIDHSRTHAWRTFIEDFSFPADNMEWLTVATSNSAPEGGCDILGIHFDRHTPLDQINCENHAQLILPAQQDALYSRHGAAIDANALARQQVGMRLKAAQREGGA